MRICVITFPMSRTGDTPLSHLLELLTDSFTNVHLITGGTYPTNKKVHTYEVRHRASTSVLARAVNYVHTQLKISFKLWKIRKSVDVCIFFVGGEGLLLPMLLTRLLKIELVLSLAGFPSRGQHDSLSFIIDLLSNAGLSLADKIVVYSERVVAERGLEKYLSKISVAHEHFIDFDKFTTTKQLAARKKTVGYIGRLSEEKGVLNLLQAILLIKDDGINFFIAGEGVLTDTVREFANNHNNVRFVGWVPHEELPKYLNELKLLVLPSYSEGLPNIILESIACGTPTLVTSVGAIPDIIEDEKTGFITENNSPECIANDIIRAVSYSELGIIVKNAHSLIEREYAKDVAANLYLRALTK